ncbi:apolipoprotein N-acyltransferase [Fortiea contorta]|uniref:apolipoprotein N-acyltransferase n=1 Tax=Fortiea contorta TaxID=1892405 RepID=UPI000348C496|nr:apolipoprotein N-acyltransferase [Fortiea contorta]
MKYEIKTLISALSLYTSSFLSGVFMGLTVAPVGAWFLAWIALIPLWILILGVSKRPNLLLPLLWGMGYHGTALSWITGIHPMTWLGVPWWPSLMITLVCWLFISLWGGALVTAWAICLRYLQQQKPLLRVLVATSAWCALEALWSAGPLWWSSLAYTQSPQNLIILHLGQISGTTAVTAVLVAVNGLIAEAWINRKTLSTRLRWVNLNLKYLTVAAILLCTSHLAGWLLYIQPLAQPPTTALKIGIIQGNIPNGVLLRPQGFYRVVETYTNGYLSLADQGVDAILTPEGALPIFQRDLQNTSFVSAVKEKGVVAWIGAFGEQGRSYAISIFTVTGKGEIFSRYDKAKLVPLGEYIPFEEVFGAIIQRLSPLDAHQVPGADNQVFDTPFGRAIASICYESAFGEVFRRQAAAGGQFILSSSNDAHYSPAMPFQHHAQDIMRAIESDRWAVRATNTGYSGFVNPHGKTLWLSGYNTYETHAETIYRRQTKTLYVRWGDWLTPSLLALSGLSLLISRRHPPN